MYRLHNLLWEKLFKCLLLRRSLYYMSGSEALPPPLSKKEEAYLISRLSEGGADIRQSLIERNIRLVVYIARKFDNTGINLEDLVSIGSIGLIKAVNTFNAEKNIKLATYASRCIENEILMFLRRSSRAKNEVSLDEPLNTDWDGNELLLSDILGTEPDAVYQEIEGGVERRLIDDAIALLPAREKQIISMRFGLSGYQEHTQKQVADILGISQSYISRLEKRIIRRIRSDIQKLI